MKKIAFVLLATVMVLLQNQTVAQRTCAAHDHMLHQLENSPKMHEKQHELEEFTQNFVRTFDSRKAGETRTIPVNVIVVYSNSNENVSDAQIQSQIDVLNLDYGGTNSDLSAVPSEFSTVTSNGTGIQFVISAIERHSSSTTSWGYEDAVKYAYPPTSPSTTLNMWICNIGGGILGYAQFPGGAESTDGVVFSPQYCGSSDYDDGSFYLSAPFDKGRTATHEVGHYLNLRHIWGDGGCTVDDYVDDTPLAGSANYSCPTYPSQSCSSNGGWTSDMFMNYMDYVDDECMFMFSEGQNARMWACLNSSRINLGYSDGNAAPTASINGPYTGDASIAIAFSSTGSSDSDGTIASFAWDFGDGASSTQANPTHSYAADGLYAVTLTVTDDGGKTGSATTTATIGNVCSGIQACDGNISLTLVTDRYASETSWTLKNSAGTTIESGSGYSNSTTYNIDWTLTEDTYTFTINDSYGDGICCSYGNGSYTITDGCASTIKTGGAIGSSESVEFCVPESGTPPVNEAPTADANGPYAALENVNIAFSSAGSNDSDGTIASYTWNFGDGGTSAVANPSYSYVSAGTYTVTLTVTDDDGATGSATATATITEEVVVNPGTTELSFDDFEGGWGNWTDGGGDCRRYSGTRAYSGSYAINIQDNSGTASSTYLTNGIDVHSAAFTSIDVHFYFYSYSMESGEDFWVQYYDGSSWNTIASFARGTDFDNNTFYQATVTINENDYNFPTDMKVRFLCDASGNADDIYLDDITISASSGVARKANNIELIALNMYRGEMDVDLVSEDLLLFPNPAKNSIQISLSIEDNTTAYIYNLSGQLVKTVELKSDNSSINISDFEAGLYFIRVNNGNETESAKFIKN